MDQNNSGNRHGFALLIIGCLFFIFGFITWANSQLIPYLKIACQLSDTQSFLVASAFFAAYFVMALPSSYVLERTGFKRGMSLGLIVMAIGALLFIPAAGSRSYPLFLTGLFIQGTGLALLQTATNPYVTILGPIESAAKRMSIMGICNKLAGIIAVYVLGGIALKDADGLIARLKEMNLSEQVVELDALASRVIQPYLVIAGVLILLALLLLFMNLPEVKEAAEEHEEKTNSHSTNRKTGIFQYPHLILGALAIFFYVGVEVISYDTFANFGQAMGYNLDTARHFASYTGYGLLAGYLLSIVAIPKLISQRSALIVAVILSMIMVLLSVFLKGNPDVATLSLFNSKITIPLNAAIWCFALLGFTNSVIWPAIWPLALDGVGHYAKAGGALLIMMIVGGAVLPPLYGAFSEWIGDKQMGYLIMIPCYLYILFFAVKGSKIKS